MYESFHNTKLKNKNKNPLGLDPTGEEDTLPSTETMTAKDGGIITFDLMKEINSQPHTKSETFKNEVKPKTFSEKNN